MKFLHTSDWHIGLALYGKKRLHEHAQFLDWLKDTIAKRSIDALIVSGDVFDNGAPGGGAETLYYDFLNGLQDTCCTAVVIVSGNHDSPRRLEAPAGFMKRLNIHVVGLPKSPGDGVIELRDASGEVGALCCAVPYLRKHEMTRVDDDTDGDDLIAAATKRYFGDIAQAAEEKRKALGKDVPVIATGHLFAAGAKTREGDGTRELYVGSLGQVGADVFPETLKYVALGHIHGAQTVAGNQRIRYCGSPLAMSFSEAQAGAKCVLEVDTNGMQVTGIDVPAFQKMARVSGSKQEILAALAEIKDEDVWLEVTYTGQDISPTLARDVHEAVSGGKAEVLSVRNNAVMNRIIERGETAQTLETMSVADVFLQCLNGSEMSAAQREEMAACFNEVLREVEERDACE